MELILEGERGGDGIHSEQTITTVISKSLEKSESNAQSCSQPPPHHNTFEVSTNLLSNSIKAMPSLPEELHLSSLQCENLEESKINIPRIRKIKRPFSPDSVESCVRSLTRSKKRRTQAIKTSNVKQSQPDSFSCDLCGSMSIVNPSRCRLSPGQVKKTPTRRQKIDPVSNKVLSLCNACGLAFSRPPRKEAMIIASNSERDKYFAEAIAFAKSLADRLAKPAAERLYCPSFKARPCGCLQTYISHQDGDGSTLESKVESLLQLFGTACDLNRRRNLFPEYKEGRPKTQDRSSANSIDKKQRQRDYEDFVLQTRLILRDKLRLCERACQKVLLYSNNFLHKRLKSSPDQSSRLAKQCGRGPTAQLKPIDELSNISCCSDKCSRLAFTHSNLLKEWRKQAAEGQRQARRVLAEMLTPSGGTKANCYKFISMVTGCGPTTISSVSYQMRTTKGEREPPEHGLKRWHKVNPRKNKKQVLENEGGIDHVDISRPSLNVEAMEQDARTLIEQQRKELEETKHQLILKQQELDECHEIIDKHLQSEISPQEVNPPLNPLWKVNIISSSLDGEGSGSQFLNLPVEASMGIIPELSDGHSVEIIDLVPGTYIAVPSNFDSSSIFTLASNSKEIATNSDLLQSENLSSCQEIILPDSLNLVSNSYKTNNLTLIPESSVPAIYKLSSVSAETNTLLGGVGGQIQSIEVRDTEVFAPVPPNCNGAEMPKTLENIQSVPVNTTREFQPLRPSHRSPNQMGISNYEATPCRTTVITPSTNTSSEKCIFNSQLSTSVHSSSSENSLSNCAKREDDGAFEMSRAILLQSNQDTTFNSLDQLFD